MKKTIKAPQSTKEKTYKILRTATSTLDLTKITAYLSKKISEIEKGINKSKEIGSKLNKKNFLNKPTTISTNRQTTKAAKNTISK
ncbi:MAG: hypothetical protein RCG15_00135 [Candidatus Rickettsia vulgarisii]